MAWISWLIQWSVSEKSLPSSYMGSLRFHCESSGQSGESKIRAPSCSPQTFRRSDEHSSIGTVQITSRTGRNPSHASLHSRPSFLGSAPGLYKLSPLPPAAGADHPHLPGPAPIIGLYIGLGFSRDGLMTSPATNNHNDPLCPSCTRPPSL